ncbi:cytochrome P450 [Flammula alnicola]|nr:cytochrome P450 [Flammula alnicola]
MAHQLLVSLLATVGVYGLYKLAKFLYDQWTSPLRVLPGPPNSSFIFGNLKEIWEAENSVLHEKWVEQYGSTIKYKAFVGSNRLYTIDTKALNHVLMNNYIYQRPEVARYNLSRILGNGVLVVEEDKHKQQNPAFGAAQIRELTEIFVEKSIQLRDIWEEECNKEGTNGRVEVLSWLSKMTLDVIGLAGFNYKFDALSGDANELNEAFSTIFRSETRVSLIPIIRGMFPALRFLRNKRDADTKRAAESMDRIGNQLLSDSKAAVMDNKTSWTRRDLLSCFTGTTWALFALTQNLEAQTKLRNELLAVGTDNPTMDELNALPYLDAVVRETLRVHAPVPATTRVAVQDDILPLNSRSQINMEISETLLIPILAMNRAKSFGVKMLSEAATTIPGVWGNMMTFLGGPRACIGYRFSLVEYVLIFFNYCPNTDWPMSPAVPASDIAKKAFIVQRPLLKSDPKGGNQMPLILKPVNRA